MLISYNSIMFNVKRGAYKYLGEGSSRKVFDLNNGYVVKIAKNMAGVEQNRIEYMISEDDNSNLLAKVVQASNNYDFIIMRRARKVKDILDVWDYFNVTSKNEFLDLPELKRLKIKYNLLLNDLNKKTSWGTISGRPVIIDYGFTKRVRERYY